MIAHLRGRLASVEGNQAVLDVNGVGYLLSVSGRTLARLPAVGAEAHLHTVLVVREESVQLYGFAGREERRAFELLTQVTGVGPKLALAVLTALDPTEIGAAVAQGDAAALARVPGIGKKTAQRLVLELKGKMGGAGDAAEEAAAASDGGLRGEATAALMALGYGAAEAERAAATAASRLGAGATVEEVVRQGLQELARR